MIHSSKTTDILLEVLNIALFIFITKFRGTGNIMWNIPYSSLCNMGIFYITLSVPRNIVMDLNNVMNFNRSFLKHSQLVHL